MKKAVYIFGCPVCRKTFKADEPGEPCCTGPSEMRDDHEMVVMHLRRIDQVEVHPRLAEDRANGALLMPFMEQEIRKELVVITQKEPSDDKRIYSFPRLIVPASGLRELESTK